MIPALLATLLFALSSVAAKRSVELVGSSHANLIRMAIAANKPYLIDVNINADQNPGGAGVWAETTMSTRPDATASTRARSASMAN